MSHSAGGRGRGRAYYAIIAGLCASCASLFGKLTSTTTTGSIDGDDHDFVDDGTGSTMIAMTVLWQSLCFILMIICNSMVWTFFVKALHEDGGTLVATVTSAATNYCCSAFLGCIVFGETTTAAWWLGTFLVIIGLVLIAKEPIIKHNQKKL